MATHHLTEAVEQWRAVVDYEGLYEISRKGTLRRLVATRKSAIGTSPTQFVANHRYKVVHLRKEERNKTHYVHRLVAMAWFGPPPTSEYQVNHIDGNKLNNNITNLQWVTSFQNDQHATETGLKPRGIHHGNAKLTDEDIRGIRARRGLEPQKVTAKRYGVSQQTIQRIQAGKAWRHVQ